MKQRIKVIKTSKGWGLATLAGALLSAVLWSCDEGIDYVEGLNAAPTVEVVGYKDGDNIRIKGDGKSSFRELTVMFDDREKNIKRLKITDFSEGRLNVFSANEQVPTNVFYPLRVTNPVEAERVYRFEIAGSGKVAVGIRVEDSFGKGSEVVLSLEVLENAKPVAVLEAYEGELGEYILDGSKSYDGDAAEGGKVAGYVFTFLGKEVRTTKSKIGVSLTETGNYTVELVVYDDEGLPSDKAQEVIMVK